MRLHLVDHLILVAYLVGMMLLGWRLSKRQHSDEEYFLGGRRMPWFAVGVSLIATLLSSVAYLGTPGVVWRFGFAIFLNTLVGIAITVVLVLFVTIPFFVRFRFTTAYEYLEHRFNLSVRLLGATMFLLFMTIYMGVIVLLSARALAVASGLPLLLIIVSVGTVATLYTMMGGIRAVIWTDVIQVALLVGGGLFAIGYVAMSTGSGPLDWIQAVNSRDNESMPLASLDPTIPATVVTLILGGCLWTLMAHTANQTIMQRYFSTVDMRAAKRSYVTSAAVDVLLLVLLTVIGASLIYYFTQGSGTLPPDLDPASGKDRDGIFPYFVATRHSRRTRRRHLRRPPGRLHVHHRLGRQLLRHRGHHRFRPVAPETDEKSRGPGPCHHPGRGTDRHDVRHLLRPADRHRRHPDDPAQDLQLAGGRDGRVVPGGHVDPPRREPGGLARGPGGGRHRARSCLLGRTASVSRAFGRRHGGRVAGDGVRRAAGRPGDGFHLDHPVLHRGQPGDSVVAQLRLSQPGPGESPWTHLVPRAGNRLPTPTGAETGPGLRPQYGGHPLRHDLRFAGFQRRRIEEDAGTASPPR